MARLEARSLANRFYPSVPPRRTALLEFALSHPVASSKNTTHWTAGFLRANFTSARAAGCNVEMSDMEQGRRERKGKKEFTSCFRQNSIGSLRVAHG